MRKSALRDLPTTWSLVHSRRAGRAGAWLGAVPPVMRRVPHVLRRLGGDGSEIAETGRSSQTDLAWSVQLPSPLASATAPSIANTREVVVSEEKGGSRLAAEPQIGGFVVDGMGSSAAPAEPWAWPGASSERCHTAGVKGEGQWRDGGSDCAEIESGGGDSAEMEGAGSEGIEREKDVEREGIERDEGHSGAHECAPAGVPPSRGVHAPPAAPSPDPSPSPEAPPPRGVRPAAGPAPKPARIAGGAPGSAVSPPTHSVGSVATRTAAGGVSDRP
eukprot:scaffold3149_cov118-Isochrysis_galbana.AAC.3